LTESPNATFAVPGIGAITDAAGNTYTVGPAKVARVDGAPIPGGADTAILFYHNHSVYGKDATTGVWYEWVGKAWVVAAPAPPAPIISKITVSPISNKRLNAAFAVAGTFTIASSAKLVTDTGATVSVAPEPVKFSFQHPGYKAAGNYVVTVEALGSTGKSNTFSVA
jgi:hypothetical protein